MNKILVCTKKDFQGLVNTLRSVSKYKDPFQRAFALDTETHVPGDGRKKSLKKEGLILDRARIMYISIARNDIGWGIPLSSGFGKGLPTDFVMDALKPFLCSKDLLKICHCCNYDINMFKNHGVAFNLDSMYCTMIASHAWDERLPLSLKERCTLVDMRLRATKTVDMTDLKDITEYAVDDALATWRLYAAYEKGRKVVVNGKRRNMLLKGVRRKFFTMEMQALKGVIRMERRGVKIDIPMLKSIDRRIDKKMDFLAGKIYVKNGSEFNLASRPQLSEFLFEKLKLPVLFETPSGKPSTDKFSLSSLRGKSKYVEFVVRYNALKSLKHYVSETKGLQLYADSNGRIHATYSQVGARTARASVSVPNLQQIPSKTDTMGIRGAFIAGPGRKLIVADMDQLELRLMANHSQDQMMLKAYKNGISIHIQTGVATGLLPKGVTKEQIKDDIKLARAYVISKSANFALMYEGTAWTLRNQLILEGLNISEDECEDIVHKYWGVYSGVPEYRNNLYALCREKGFITNICGRHYRITNYDSPVYKLRKAAERQIVNTVIQGGGADWLKLSMIRIDKDEELKDYGYRMLLAIHDEVVGDCKDKWAEKAAQRKKALMEIAPEFTTIELSVPLMASVGIADNWKDAK